LLRAGEIGNKNIGRAARVSESLSLPITPLHCNHGLACFVPPNETRIMVVSSFFTCMYVGTRNCLYACCLSFTVFLSKSKIIEKQYLIIYTETPICPLPVPKSARTAQTPHQKEGERLAYFPPSESSGAAQQPRGSRVWFGEAPSSLITKAAQGRKPPHADQWAGRNPICTRCWKKNKLRINIC
jgi:hypothetical protein